MDEAFFIYLMTTPNRETVDHLDRLMCGCGYIRHWVYNMGSGKWNPMLNEMDAELKDVRTLEDLYRFINTKGHDIQEHPIVP